MMKMVTSYGSLAVNQQERVAPNILLVIADHHRWDWLGAAGYGTPVRTPTLDRLARRGMLFNQCRCGSPLCAPSRASLATGLRPHRTGVLDNDQDLHPDSLTFMQLLRARGYRTATCGKCDLHKKTKWYGLHGWTSRLGRLGFTEAIDQAGKIDAALLSGWPSPHDPYMAFMHKHGLAETHHMDYARRMRSQDEAFWPCPFGREFYTDDFCGRAALSLLERLPTGEPWFLEVNFPGPHEPYDAPEELLRRYDNVDFAPPANPHPTFRRNYQAFRRSFAAMIEGIDEWVGRIENAVVQRGDLDNTVIVYTSDHGEMLGDNGYWGKNRPHDPSVRVPLIVAGPGVGAGVRSDALVELSDLAATLVDCAGAPTPSHWDAASLAPVLAGRRQMHREATVSMLGNWQMITDGRWKLVADAGAGDTLWDLHKDPTEERNVVREFPDEAKRLHKLLADELNSGK